MHKSCRYGQSPYEIWQKNAIFRRGDNFCTGRAVVSAANRAIRWYTFFINQILDEYDKFAACQMLSLLVAFIIIIYGIEH